MKKLIFMLGLLFAISTIVSAQTNSILTEKVRLETQLQQAMTEINRLNIVINDVKTERNALIVTVAEVNRAAIAQNAGLEKTRLILQDAINNGGKVDWKTLINDVKWNLVLPDSTDTGKKPTKDKKGKDK